MYKLNLSRLACKWFTLEAALLLFVTTLLRFLALLQRFRLLTPRCIGQQGLPRLSAVCLTLNLRRRQHFVSELTLTVVVPGHVRERVNVVNVETLRPGGSVGRR